MPIEQSPIKEISKNSSSLKKRISDLEKQTNEQLKIQRKVGYVANTPVQFIQKNTKLNTVSPLFNQASTTARFNSKIEKQQIEKAEQEVAECTFKPEINQKSKVMSQAFPKHNHRAERKVNAVSLDIILQQSPDQTQKINRTFNKEFYNEKMEWKKERQNKRIKDELMISGVQTIRANAFPKTNKQANQIVGQKHGDFETRLVQKMAESKIIKEKLDGAIYNHTFKPNLNKGESVQHAVYQPAKPKLA